MLTATAALAGWALVSVAAASGTYALWTDARTLDAGVVRSGTSDLGIAGTIPPSAFANLLPGERVAASISVHNSGTTALDLTAAIAAASAAFDVRVVMNAPDCGSTALTGAALSAAPAALGALAAGASAPLCVEVTALPALTPAASASFAVTVAGEQE